MMPSLDDAQTVIMRALTAYLTPVLSEGTRAGWLAIEDVENGGGDRYDRGVSFALADIETGTRREFQISITSEDMEGRTT